MDCVNDRLEVLEEALVWAGQQQQQRQRELELELDAL
jgi:hypothetical protein